MGSTCESVSSYRETSLRDVREGVTGIKIRPNLSSEVDNMVELRKTLLMATFYVRAKLLGRVRNATGKLWGWMLDSRHFVGEAGC